MAFTTITGSTTCNQRSLALEIAVALNKRCAVAGVSGVTVPSVGTNHKTFLRAAQLKVEAVATAFTDPAATLTGQPSLPASWTLSAAMTAAGLTTSGYWRRIPSGGSLPATWSTYGDAAYSYGPAQDNDLIGPWLFADLMAALSKLTRHVSSPGDTMVDFYGENINSPADSTSEYELSGTVNLPYEEGSSDAGVLISKEALKPDVYPPVPVRYDAYGWVAAARFMCPTNDITGATETRTLVWLPTGDEAFTALTGLASASLNKTLTASPNQSGTGYRGRYLPDTPANMSALSYSWVTLSEMVTWPDPPETGLVINSLSLLIVPTAVVLVTDYAMSDGSTT